MLNPVTELLAHLPAGELEHLEVTGLRSIAHLLPASKGRGGIYVLGFANGEHYVGQSVNGVARFAGHRATYADITEVAFWRVPRAQLDTVERAEIHRLETAGVPLRNVIHTMERLGATDLDTLVSPADQRQWLVGGLPAWAERDIRPDRPDHRRRGRLRYETLAGDPRFPDLVYAVREYVAAAVPFPRRTEMVQWSISAAPSTNKASYPRLLTLTIHSVETVFVCHPIGEPDRRSVLPQGDSFRQFPDAALPG